MPRVQKSKQTDKPKKKSKKLALFGEFGDFKLNKALYAPYDVYRFKHRAADSVITQAALSATLGVYIFRLSDVQAYTEFTAMFDSYRIDAVRLTFHPLYNMQAITTNATITPRLYVIFDYDDKSTPGTLGELLEYQTLRTCNFNQQMVRAIQPRVAANVYGNGAFGNYGMFPVGQWIDCASPDVDYYCVKYGIDPGASGQTNLAAWAVSFEYYLSFKYVR